MTVSTTPAPSPDHVSRPTARTWARTRLGADWGRLWSAGLTSLLGDGMMIAAMPLLAMTVTSDPRQISAVGTCAGLPWLLLSLPAGGLTDRLDRRRLMIASQWAQAVVMSGIAALATFGGVTIWRLCAAAFALGAAETVFRGASEAVLPALVSRDHLVRANARQQSSNSIAQSSVGPPLGAALFALAMPLPFWLDAVSFLVSLSLIARIRARPEFRPPATNKSLGSDVVDGVRWLVKHPLLRSLTLLAGVGNLCNFMAVSTMVLFAKQVLGLDQRGYGLLVGGIALGGVLGALLSRPAVARFGLRRALLVVPFISPVALLSVGLLGRQAVVVGLLAAGGAFALSLWNVVSFTLRQINVPSELLGRVGGAGKMVSFGAGPLGALAGGFIAHSFGLAAPWVVAGALRLAVVLVATPTLRRQNI